MNHDCGVTQLCVSLEVLKDRQPRAGSFCFCSDNNAPCDDYIKQGTVVSSWLRSTQNGYIEDLGGWGSLVFCRGCRTDCLSTPLSGRVLGSTPGSSAVTGFQLYQELNSLVRESLLFVGHSLFLRKPPYIRLPQASGVSVLCLDCRDSG